MENSARMGGRIRQKGINVDKGLKYRKKVVMGFWSRDGFWSDEFLKSWCVFEVVMGFWCRDENLKPSLEFETLMNIWNIYRNVKPS